MYTVRELIEDLTSLEMDSEVRVIVNDSNTGDWLERGVEGVEIDRKLSKFEIHVDTEDYTLLDNEECVGMVEIIDEMREVPN